MSLKVSDDRLCVLAEKLLLDVHGLQLELMKRDANYYKVYQLIFQAPDSLFAHIPTALMPKRAAAVMLWYAYKPDNHPVKFKEHFRILRNACVVQSATFSEDSQPEQSSILEEPTMTNNTVPFSTVNYVFGVDVTTLSAGQLIAAIKRAEDMKGPLETIKRPSKKITALIAEIDADIDKIVAVLDAKA
jgi:hypothetical protein